MKQDKVQVDLATQKVERSIHFKPLNALVFEALIAEAQLYPKPGLVDSVNTGAHTDMNIETFHRSAEAIAPFMAEFARVGYISCAYSATEVLTLIRPIGLECESAMFAATNHVNTHKGAIFTFGLLCAAIGRLHAVSCPVLDAYEICVTGGTFCQGLVSRELEIKAEMPTAGIKAYQQHGLAGARGEAQSGFCSIRDLALPVFQKTAATVIDMNTVQLHVLMQLIAHNNDTNLVARGGIEGLAAAKRLAGEYLARGSVFSDREFKGLQRIDQIFIAHRWSPGGSADLLAATIFLHHIHKTQLSDH